MQVLRFNDLPQGGFAGLIERRFVTDVRLFGRRREPGAVDGIGNFVYLADANFLPHGETGMHSHHEIDVISIMVSGRISHAGSLEQGQELLAGTVQVQRAGGEGFAHNEINPDGVSNHMIQLWVAPDQAGEPAGYRVYAPAKGERQRVYGGPKGQDETFDSRTSMDVVNTVTSQRVSQEGEVMAYLTRGSGTMNGELVSARTLVRVNDLEFVPLEESQLILVYQNG